MTRFGQISPPWQIFKSIEQFLEDLFIIWLNFHPTLAKLYAIGQIFIVVSGQIMNK